MTQLVKVKETIGSRTMTLADVQKATGIKGPNIRRILGQGTKSNIFERIEKGVYRLLENKKVIVYVRLGSAADILPELIRKGFKADMIFLDPPYLTPAVKGGNRPMQFETITPELFRDIMQSIAEIVRTVNTPVYYMFSRADSGWKAMEKYNIAVLDAGFKIVSDGNYHKTYKSGKPIINVKGKIAKPEGLWLLTKSGQFREKEEQRNLEFNLIRPNTHFKKGGYPTKKPLEMGRSLIRQGTLPEDIIVDPFIGSGMMVEASVIENRKVVACDVSRPAIVERVIPAVRSVVNSMINDVVIYAA